jgi:hypothetical protein
MKPIMDGMATAAIVATMTVTTTTSIRVNPFRDDNLFLFSNLFTKIYFLPLNKVTVLVL